MTALPRHDPISRLHAAIEQSYLPVEKVWMEPPAFLRLSTWMVESVGFVPYVVRSTYEGLVRMALRRYAAPERIGQPLPAMETLLYARRTGKVRGGQPREARWYPIERGGGS